MSAKGKMNGHLQTDINWTSLWCESATKDLKGFNASGTTRDVFRQIVRERKC